MTVVVGLQGSTMEQEDGMWNRRRHDLRYALARIDDDLSDLYRHLIDCLAEPLTVGRLVVASHCVRELSNNLVDYLGDVEDLPEYVDGSRHRRLLASKWSEHQEVVGPSHRPLGEPPVTGSTGQEPAALVTVPRDLLEAARLVVEVETGGTDRAGSRVSALMTARVDLADSASVRLLRDSLRFFTRYVHLRHGTSIELPPREELLRHLTRFEEALMGRVGDFFTRRNEILDLLARANQQTTVTEDDVDR